MEYKVVEVREGLIGGKLSGEHGIGIKRKKYMERMTDPVELKMMRSIKRALDPNNIMNPGKMFDMEPAEQQPE